MSWYVVQSCLLIDTYTYKYVQIYYSYSIYILLYSCYILNIEYIYILIDYSHVHVHMNGKLNRFRVGGFGGVATPRRTTGETMGKDPCSS